MKYISEYILEKLKISKESCIRPNFSNGDFLLYIKFISDDYGKSYIKLSSMEFIDELYDHGNIFLKYKNFYNSDGVIGDIKININENGYYEIVNKYKQKDKELITATLFLNKETGIDFINNIVKKWEWNDSFIKNKLFKYYSNKDLFFLNYDNVFIANDWKINELEKEIKNAKS